MNNFDYIKSKAVGEAVEIVSGNNQAAFIGGGTNLIDLWRYNITHPRLLVDLNAIKENHSIEKKEDGGIRIGAFATNAATAYHPLVEAHYPLLSKAILAGASAQIRNMATNGGNLLQRTRCCYFYDPAVPCNKRQPGSGCSAIDGHNRMHAIVGASEQCIAVFPSDMCTALEALDAVVNITGINGERSLSFTDLHRLPGNTPALDNNLRQGEVITSIDLPAKGFAKHYSYLKLRDRNSYAFALVSVASGLEMVGDQIKEARIALGGIAHKPWRVKEAEDFLKNKKAGAGNFSEAASIILHGATGYKFNQFKIELSKRAIIRNCMMALHPETQLPGALPSE